MKHLIAILAALLLSISAKAQLGLVVGVSTAEPEISSAWSGLNTADRYSLGLQYRFPMLGEVLVVQPGVIFKIPGTELGSLGGKDTYFAFDQSFVEVPVQVQLGVPLFKLIRVYGFVEPFLGITWSDLAVDCDCNITSSVEMLKHRLDSGVGLGAGVELFHRFQLSAKYFWNFDGNYFNVSSIDYVYGQVQHTTCNGVSFSVALLF